MYIRKIMSTILMIVLCFSFNGNVLAADVDAPYEAILNEINKQYNLELGYVPVDTSKISLEEYEEKTIEFASQQRELLNYIASQEACENVLGGRATGSYVNKTRTKDTSGITSPYYSITATYTVYDNMRISSYSSASLNRKTMAQVNNVYLTNITSPTFILLNTTRTLAVRYTATIHYDSAYGYDNTVLYAEFNYND